MHATARSGFGFRLAAFLVIPLALGWSWSIAGRDAGATMAAGPAEPAEPAGIAQTCLLGNDFEDHLLANWTSTNTSVFDMLVGGPEGSNFYVHAKDGSGASTVDAPAAYFGDWISILGGCGNFCYDVNLLDDGEPGSAAIAANFYLYSWGTVAQFLAFNISEPSGPNPGWHRICAPIQMAAAGESLPANGAGQWRINGLTTGQPTLSAWNLLVHNVTAVKFPVDWASSNQSEEVGYDNFCLSGEGCLLPTPTNTPPSQQLSGVIRTVRGCSESGPAVVYGTGETVPISLSIAGASSATVRVMYQWPDGGQEAEIDSGIIQSGQQYTVDPPLVIPPDAVPGGRRVSLQEHIAGPEYREIARCSFDVVSLATDTPTPVVPTATPTTAPCNAPGCLPPSSVLPVHNLPQEPNQNPPVSCAVADCHDGVRIYTYADGKPGARCNDCPGAAAAGAGRVKWVVGPEVLRPMPKPTRKPLQDDRALAGGIPLPTRSPLGPLSPRGAGASGSALAASPEDDWRHIPRTAFDSSALTWGSGAAVNVRSGELTLSETDVEIPGRGFDFRFERRYRSGVTFNGPLGWNWEVDLGRRLVEITPDNVGAYAQNLGLSLSPGDVLRMDGTGRVDAFVRFSDGNFVSPAGVYVLLTRGRDGSYVEVDRAGTTARFAAPNLAGVALMISVADRAGNSQQFEHNAQGRLVRVRDTLGRAIDFGYDVQGRLSFVQDFTGRRVVYAYDAGGHLIAVTSPAVTGTVNRNDFPSGKTTRYAYSEGLADPTLNHNLTSVTAPNETAVGGQPRLQVTYDTQDRVTAFRRGGANSEGEPTGGTNTYTYREVPAPPVRDINTALFETEMMDGNGNRHVYQFNEAGNTVSVRTDTNRDIRPDDPAGYETRSTYNADGELLRTTSPAGAIVDYLYDDANPDPRQRGNQIATTEQADAARGGSQSQLRSTTSYEPIFGHVHSITDPRGNDPSYSPPNGGNHSAARYTTTYVYDYQEGDNAAAMAALIGVSEAKVRSLLSAAGIGTNLGDVNGDGITNAIHGDLVRTDYPTVKLPPNALLTARTGPDQPSFELFGYNQYSQPVFHQDAEGNLTRYTYHPENDPDGDGRDRTAGMSDGPFGYLGAVVSDAGANPGPSPTPRPSPGPVRYPIFLPITARSAAIALSVRRFPEIAKLDAAAPEQAGREPAAPPWRNEGHPSAFANSRTSFLYDPVGNPIRVVNPRGVATDFEVNALNQVVQVTLASDVQPALADPAEPFWAACRNMQLPECTHGMTAFGYRTRLSYDANDNVVKIETEDKDGIGVPAAGPWIESTFTYDVLGRRLSESREITTGDVAKTAYEYDKNDNLVVVENPVYFLPDAGRDARSYTTYVYDERNMLYTASRAGMTSQFETLTAHSAVDLPTSAGEPSTLTHAYDSDGNLSTILDSVDNSSDGRPERTTVLYDGFGRVVSEVNGLGTQTFIEYDPAGNPVHSYAYGPVDGISPRGDTAAAFLQPLTAASFRQAILSESRTSYDERGRAYQVDDRLFTSPGVVLRRPAVLADGPGDVPGDGWVTSRHEWDRADRLIYLIEDDADAWRTEYDGLSRAVLAEDPEHNVTVHSYDRASNATLIARTEVPRAADVAAGRAPNVRTTYTSWLVYDALDRLIRFTDDLGQTQRVRYDSRDNPVWTADAQYSTRQSDLVLDPLAVFPSPGQTAAAARINRPGNVATTEYDGLGRPVRSVTELHQGGQGGAPIDTTNPANPDGLVVTTKGFDANGRETSRTDGRLNTTRYAYDALDRETRTTLADGSPDSSTYESQWDLDGNLVGYTDANGTVLQVTSDGLGRVTDVIVLSQAPGVVGTKIQHREFDGLGRTTRTTDGNPDDASSVESVDFKYDSLGRVLEEVQYGQLTGYGLGLVVSSRWSGDGRRLAVVYPNDRVIARTFDGLNQIDQITEGSGGTVLADYDLMGSGRVLRRTTGDGIALSYMDAAARAVVGYDAVGRVVGMRYSSPGETVLDFAYGYSRQNAPVFLDKKHAPGDGELYPYDSLSRIVGYQRGTLKADRNGLRLPAADGLQHRTWRLDGVGNWAELDSTVSGATATESRTHSALNAVTQRSGGALAYDANGNLTDDGVHAYAWDFANRLRVVTRKSDNAVIATYRYDGAGRRSEKTVLNSGSLDGVTRYVYDGWREIEERDAANRVVRQVVYGRWLDEPLLLDRDLDGDGLPTGTADRRLYFHQDAQSSTAGLTDRTGTLVEGYRYDPYGRATVYTPGPNGIVDFGGDDVRAADGASALGNPFLYTGRRFDRESGLYYYRTRYMDPVLGRFISHDTIGIWGDEANLGNGYAYVGGRAQSEVDPMGLATTVKSSKSNSDNILGGGPAGGNAAESRKVYTSDWKRLGALPASVGDALGKWHLPRVIPAGFGPPCPPRSLYVNAGPGDPIGGVGVGLEIFPGGGDGDGTCYKRVITVESYFSWWTLSWEWHTVISWVPYACGAI